MLEMTYLKELHNEEDTAVISFEGDVLDIYALKDYAKVINAAQLEVEEEYYRGFKNDCEINYGAGDEEINKVVDVVDKPSHYRSGEIETIKKIEAIVEGLPADKAYLLGNVIKYCDRAGKKDDAAQDMSKANNYAHRLVYGSWRHEH